ncbi:MAG: cryptochrome/photolyase family protein, partial [Saprospiraceae bacterium]
MTLRLILGDQLNHQHSWYETTDENVIYCFFEMRQETDYVAHHIQKVVAFFAAMRGFAEHLENAGQHVIYFRLDDARNTQSLTENLQQLIAEHDINKFEYQLPDEYRLDVQLREFCDQLAIETEAVDSEHFMTTRHELEAFFKGKKTYLMESFYRDMRKRFDIMMDGKDPVTGQWNYDKNNRKKMPKKHVPPQPLVFERDVTKIVELIENQGVKTIGRVDAKNFVWPVTRVEGLEILEFFCTTCLVHFGDFQDAMTPEYWSNYHSRISFAMNAKLI